MGEQRSRGMLDGTAGDHGRRASTLSLALVVITVGGSLSAAAQDARSR